LSEDFECGDIWREKEKGEERAEKERDGRNGTVAERVGGGEQFNRDFLGGKWERGEGAERGGHRREKRKGKGEGRVGCLG